MTMMIEAMGTIMKGTIRGAARGGRERRGDDRREVIMVVTLDVGDKDYFAW